MRKKTTIISISSANKKTKQKQKKEKEHEHGTVKANALQQRLFFRSFPYKASKVLEWRSAYRNHSVFTSSLAFLCRPTFESRPRSTSLTITYVL